MRFPLTRGVYMPGVACVSYADELPLGVRRRLGPPERPPHKPTTDCRSYPDAPMGADSTQDRPPHKPTSNCRGYAADLPPGARDSAADVPPYKPVTNCRGYGADPPSASE